MHLEGEWGMQRGRLRGVGSHLRPRETAGQGARRRRGFSRRSVTEFFGRVGRGGAGVLAVPSRLPYSLPSVACARLTLAKLLSGQRRWSGTSWPAGTWRVTRREPRGPSLGGGTAQTLLSTALSLEPVWALPRSGEVWGVTSLHPVARPPAGKARCGRSGTPQGPRRSLFAFGHVGSFLRRFPSPGRRLLTPNSGSRRRVCLQSCLHAWDPIAPGASRSRSPSPGWDPCGCLVPPWEPGVGTHPRRPIGNEKGLMHDSWEHCDPKRGPRCPAVTPQHPTLGHRRLPPETVVPRSRSPPRGDSVSPPGRRCQPRAGPCRRACVGVCVLCP